jgi:hypothetical protein
LVGGAAVEAGGLVPDLLDFELTTTHEVSPGACGGCASPRPCCTEPLEYAGLVMIIMCVSFCTCVFEFYTMTIMMIMMIMMMAMMIFVMTMMVITSVFVCVTMVAPS